MKLVSVRKYSVNITKKEIVVLVNLLGELQIQQRSKTQQRNVKIKEELDYGCNLSLCTRPYIFFDNDFSEVRSNDALNEYNKAARHER